jgi:hypothetical protein
MSRARLSAIAIFAAVVTTLTVGMLMATSHARAQTPPRAVCSEQNGASGMQGWMNQQIATGKSRFLTIMSVSCAW